MTPDQVNKYAERIYRQNVEAGWWDNPDRCPLQTLQLVVSEVAEAIEAD